MELSVLNSSLESVQLVDEKPRGRQPRPRKRCHEGIELLPVGEQRLALQCQVQLREWRDRLARGHWCENCWLLGGYCICEVLGEARRLILLGERERPVSSVASSVPSTMGFFAAPISSHFRYIENIIVYMHHKELGRGSNTGILLRALFGASIVLYGDLPLEKMLFGEKPGHHSIEAANSGCDERGEASQSEESLSSPMCIVLFPAAEAVNATELIKKFTEEELRDKRKAPVEKPDAESQGVALECSRRRLRVIVLDGTWPQARLLNRRINPAMQRVKISSAGRATDAAAPLRKKPDDGERIMTATAFLLFLQQIGEDQMVRDLLESAVKCKAHAYTHQAGAKRLDHEHLPINDLLEARQPSTWAIRNTCGHCQHAAAET